MSFRYLAILCSIALALNVSAATWYVRTDGQDGNDGRSWETAQASIRLGIDNCRAGDTLHIESGVYHEGIILKEGIVIIGEGQVILDGKDLGTRLITCEQDFQKPTLDRKSVV